MKMIEEICDEDDLESSFQCKHIRCISVVILCCVLLRLKKVGKISQHERLVLEGMSEIHIIILLCLYLCG